MVVVEFECVAPVLRKADFSPGQFFFFAVYGAGSEDILVHDVVQAVYLPGVIARISIGHDFDSVLPYV